MEGLLHGMELAVLGDALNGCDVCPFAGHCKRGAGFDRLAVNVDHAGPALAGVAAHMGSGETQIRPDKIDQQRAVFNVSTHRLAIHFHGNCGHSGNLPYGPSEGMT